MQTLWLFVGKRWDIWRNTCERIPTTLQMMAGHSVPVHLPHNNTFSVTPAASAAMLQTPSLCPADLSGNVADQNVALWGGRQKISFYGGKEEKEKEKKDDTGEEEDDKSKSKVGTRWVRQLLFIRLKIFC